MSDSWQVSAWVDRLDCPLDGRRGQPVQVEVEPRKRQDREPGAAGIDPWRAREQNCQVVSSAAIALMRQGQQAPDVALAAHGRLGGDGPEARQAQFTGKAGNLTRQHPWGGDNAAIRYGDTVSIGVAPGISLEVRRPVARRAALEGASAQVEDSGRLVRLSQTELIRYATAVQGQPQQRDCSTVLYGATLSC